MKRNIVFLYLLFLSTICFAQQNLPGRIIGEIPSISSTKLYLIQVGAYKTPENAEDAFIILQRGGLNPVYERYLDYTRVIITGIPAKQIISNLLKIKQLGFDEVIIREARIIEEIIEEVIEPEEEIIEEVIEEPEEIEEIVETEEPPPPPRWPERDIFCRTWRIVNTDKAEYIGYTMIFTDDGTFLITNANGEASVARWRWHDSIEYNEFEYTHNNWRSYGRVTIHQLDQSALIFNDPGFNILGNGYSTIGKGVIYEMVPIESFQ